VIEPLQIDQAMTGKGTLRPLRLAGLFPAV